MCIAVVSSNVGSGHYETRELGEKKPQHVQVDKIGQSKLTAASVATSVLLEQINQNFSPIIYNAILKIQLAVGPLILTNFSKASVDAQFFLAELVDTFEITTDDVAEILKGAHFRLEDDGVFYKKWELTEENKTDRSYSSSHKIDAKQYSVQNPIFTEFLWSRITINGKTYTWGQAEAHEAKGQFFAHMGDFARYRWTGKNQGPWGESPYTEAQPLILRFRVRS